MIKSLENSGSLIDVISKTVKNKTKKQEGGFLGMLLGISEVPVLGNMLTEKWVMRTGKSIFSAGTGSNIDHVG